MKKIILFVILILISVFCCIFIIGKSTSKTVDAKVKDPEFTVVIDAGHGGFDGGATSVNGDVEKNINLSISLYLRDYLEFFGINTILTRETDTSLEDDGLTTIRQKKTSDIHNRLNLFNSVDNSILVSIHQNHFTDEKYSGAQMFYSPQNETQSSVLAECLQQSIVKNIQMNNTREIKKCDTSVYLIYNSAKPAVLAECGFLSNENEASLLTDKTYQKKIALSLALGILDYYSN